jgi:molybdate transport system substrate-binding protein
MMGRFFSRRVTLAAAVECSFLLALGAAASAAQAAEVKVMSTVALTPTLKELIPKYESSSGNKLTVIYSTIADLKKRIEAGETADVMILSRPVLDGLQTQGKVAQGSIVNVGNSYVAIGVRTGTRDLRVIPHLLKHLPYVRKPKLADVSAARIVHRYTAASKALP